MMDMMGMGGSSGQMGMMNMGGNMSANMGGSAGQMGMDMMNMGNSQMANAMGNMGNMSGMVYPNAMSGMQGMQGMQGAYPNSMAGMANQGLAGTNNGLFGGGLGFNSLISGLLNLAIDIFAILLLVGLIVGVAVIVKRYLLEGEFFAPRAKATCSNCGQVLSAEWHCCPKCGQPKAVPQTIVSPQTV